MFFNTMSEIFFINLNYLNCSNQNDESPLSDKNLSIIGWYLLVLFVLCIIFNTSLLVILIRNKELRITINIFVFLTTVFNLFGSIQLPLSVYSAFNIK